MHSKWIAKVLAACLGVVVAPVAAQNTDYVYRVDSRPPDLVFATGWVPWGTNINVVHHAFEGSCDASPEDRRSAYVSTTESEDQARLFAEARLRGIQADGTSETMWMYTIRADTRFLSVRRLLSQAMEMGYNNQNGYTYRFAMTVRNMLTSTPLTLTDEVLAPEIATAQIREARPYWYQAGQLMLGPSYVNHGYMPDDTHIGTDVPANIHALVPPDMTRTPSRASSCAMQCDKARGSSSSTASTYDGSVQCRIWSGGMSPAMIRSVL